MPPEVCPNCGTDVPPKAKACPECGSDETTGWSETAYASSLGLPDEEFDHDKFVKDEFGSSQVRPQGISRLWWVIAAIVAILMSLSLLWGVLHR